MSRYSSMSTEELIRACTELDDGAAWEEFVSRFQKAISLSIQRTSSQWGKDPAQFVGDLLQETYLKLCADKCRLLLEFAREHSDEVVLGYIRMIAINVALVWLPLLTFLIAPEATTRRLAAFNAWLRRHSHVILSVVLIAAGLILAINGLTGLIQKG